MTSPPPAKRLNLTVLTPEDFERLCFLAVEIKHPDAIHVGAPDYGADAALAAPDGRWIRCWQAKRFTGSISWPQCKSSLDAAVAHYRMPRFTFCFAKNLTGPQTTRFGEHLVGRHKGVQVDFWGQSKLESVLFGSPQGERIVKTFFGDPTIDTQKLMQALRSAGALEDASDAMDRLGAVAEYLEALDPFYWYAVVGHPEDQAGPTLTPGTIISASTVDEGIVRRIDAVPRSKLTFEQLPGGTMSLQPEQVEALDLFLRMGGTLELDQVPLELRNMPRGLPQPNPDAVEDLTWFVQMRAPAAKPQPWNARFLAGEAVVEFHLEPGEPPADWDGLLEGTTDGLQTTLRVRARNGRDEAQMTWHFTDDSSLPAEQRARTLRFVEALAGGTMRIEDIDDEQRVLEFARPAETPEPWITVLRQYLDDLVVVEAWLGRRLPALEELTGADVDAMHKAASIIRDGGVEMRFESVSLEMPRDRFEETLGKPAPTVGVEQGFALRMLDEEIPIGSVFASIREVDVKVEQREPGPDGADWVTVRVTPKAAAAGPAWFTLKPRLEAGRRTARVTSPS